ncbi:16S rRNA (cytidine(1402)-2'-O)-methyltransferase [Microcoleus sp. FACHB-68]|uniref:16S rRNA (cytidine(1402)-2'-O)-methyltransferase n=1 Tax=Microcoleus sp. FACHB-68 TaxID=2692826 RepID=UPI0016850069|nr:16S rRNA (cytidine(1402)-2'-O)-methyltransferase [Microcoleus sp. FACHB-68]MBD1940431.1 16S rRNA (cytidine(1402)-2'-O)-methyltransferase [Microcoleus sp. FACHB-68]
METEPKPSTLYVVGTPIGNLEDMTFRAVRILQAVDVIAAEDTRHTGKLLQHFQIKTSQISYHEHNRQQRIPQLVEMMLQGQTIALVTDAGMPAISDPGYELVKACIEAGIPVVPVPGPTAVIAALCACGLPADRFVFEGFLPAKGKDRQSRLQAIQTEFRTMILYEAPHRLLQTLQDLKTFLGTSRQIVVARELTKLHEEFWRGTLEEATAHYDGNFQVKGEISLVVAGCEMEVPAISEETLKAELQALLNQGISRSEASRLLAQQTSLPRRQIYQLALTILDESD